MVRSFFKAYLGAAIADGAALVLARRGHSSAYSSVARGVSKQMENKALSLTDGGVNASDAAFWVPDPVTGFYRPANRVRDIDAAELRKLLLTRESTPQQ